MWTTKWWAQIAGWIFFPVTVAAAVIAISPDLWDYIYHGEEQLHLRSPNVKNHYWGHCYSWNPWCHSYYDDDGEGSYYWAGGFVLAMEIAGWSMFYSGYKDAIKYGEYLIEANKEAMTADASF